MAGDWIKVEKATINKPEILHLATLLEVDPYHALGICIHFWSWCDDQLQTGHAKNVTTSQLNHIMACPMFAESLVKVGWLRVADDALVIPNFNRHLSENAKNRGLSYKRKQKSRSRFERDKSVTREEKRREEKEVGGGREVSVDLLTAPTVSASPVLPCGTVQGIAEMAASAYQARRYKTPNPRAAYYPVLLQEAADVFEAATDQQAALDLFLRTCKTSPLPKDASFSDLAKSCGLKKQKAKVNDRPSQQLKDYTAERLAKQMAIE